MGGNKLNYRLRKVLGFRTLFEVFFGKTVRNIKPPLGVALRN
jgi:transposase, IS30 family